MYRLVLYYLIFLLAVALALGYEGILPYSPSSLALTALALLVYSWAANTLFAGIFKVPANAESVYITALILALIISPAKPAGFLASVPFLIWASVWAMGSKFIANIGGKHIFNPAAFAVALTALTISQSASWWVGSPAMLPAVLIGGLLVIRKVRRFDAVIAFTAGALLTIFLLTVGKGNTILTLQRSIISSPLIFFAAIMLTEPLTMPPERNSRIVYGFLIGWMFAPETHLDSFYFTPELALLAGNLYSYVVSPKGRHALKLLAKQEAGQNIYNFLFAAPKGLAFKPGQYMEWTMPLKRGDSRGNRRFLTLASSPTEKNLLLGVKFYPDPSRFKQELGDMDIGGEIIGGQLSGDFVLPESREKKLVFVAGGIGITPFRSMLKYLIDRNEKRPIVTLYSNRQFNEIVYTDVLEEARQKLGINTFYALTDLKQIPEGWQGQKGHFNPGFVARAVPDFKEREFYISGSHNMVTGFKELLLGLGVHRIQIKTDFFPGLV